jgi:hypothetical protein
MKGLKGLSLLLLVSLGVLLLVGVTAGEVEGATITVPDDYPTINSAVENATDYDTLFIKDGNYTETVIIWRPLRVMGESQDGTVIWSEDPFAMLIVAHRTSVSRLTVGGTTTGAGMILQATGCTVENVTVKESLWGLWVNRGDNNVVRGVDCIDNQWQGLLVEEADHTLLEHVTCSGNNEGIMVRAAVDTVIQDCVSENNRVHGLRVERLVGFYETERLQVIGCVIANNTNNGIEVSDTFDVLVKGCTVTDNQWSAMRFDRCDSVVVYNNHVENYARLGIAVQGGSLGCVIEGNTVMDEGTSWSDIIVHGVEQSIIRANYVECLSSAISVLWANHTLVVDNYMVSTNDNASVSTVGVIVGRHRAGVEMPPTNVTLLRNEVSGFTEGIEVRGGWDIDIIDCIVRDAETGIYFYVFDYGDDPIVGGWVKGCTLDGCGMVIEGMMDVMVEGNLIKGAEVGIRFNATSKTIEANTFMNNVVRDCSQYALIFDGTNGTNVFHTNAFINNTEHSSAPFDDDVFNTFKYGNYWDDYEENYPDASIDGVVWDTPYAVAGSGVTDMYPLAYPYDETDPLADAGEDRTVSAGTEVTLDASGSRDDGTIVNYTWTFEHAGVPVELEGKTVVFTFRSVFVHDVTLSVVDAWGNMASDNVTILVYDDEEPVADAGDDLVVDMDETFTLDASASTDNGWIIRWKWVVEPEGDAVVLEEETVDLWFTEPGRFLVLLSVMDEAGNVGEDALFVTVRDTVPPVAYAGRDISVDQGTAVTLYGGWSTDNVAVDTWTWILYEDGEPVILLGETAEYTFSLAGEYNISLNVTDAAGNWDVDRMSLTVRDTEPPTAAAGEDKEVDQWATVSFDASGSSDNVGIVWYIWTLAEGTTISRMDGPQPEYAFGDPGTYDIELEVWDAAGNVNYDTITVTVNPVPMTRLWRLGPFKDDEGYLGGVRVEVLVNGSTYVDYTQDDGWVEYTLSLYDLVSPVGVIATKEGWDYLEFSLDLDGSGGPTGTIPVMEQTGGDGDGHDDDGEEEETDWLAWGLVIVLVIAFAGTLLYLSNAAKRAGEG